jgi:hypothetical protein
MLHANLIADTVGRDAERMEHVHRDPVVLIKETDQHVLGVDVPLSGVTRLFPSQDDDLTRAICEPFQASRIAARHAPRTSGSGRRASTSRLLGGVVPPDRSTHRLHTDAKRRLLWAV